jgi:hypothetical protein
MPRFDRRESHTAYLFGSVSLVAPACRMVIVESWAWADGDESTRQAGHRLHPVVALQACVRREYSKAAQPGEYPRRGATPVCNVCMANPTA